MNDQQAAFEKLSVLRVGALFMETGTGKTKVGLDLMAYKRPKVDYLLWICPFSVRQEIEAERLRWHPELEIEIMGCESIGSSDRIFVEVLRKVSTQRTFIVVDESLKIKNIEAKRTTRIIELGKHAQYRLILNGTPVSKNVVDLWAQMEFLSPKILNMTLKQFRDSYCEYYIRGPLKNRVKTQYNIPHLISVIEPYIFDSELYLGKEQHYHHLTYGIEDPQRYMELKERFLDFDSDSAFFAIATTLQHYYCSTATKMRLVDDLTERLEGQVIVFVKYIDSIPYGAERYTGETTDRAKTLERFRNGEFRVLYMTYGCGSFGLNLQFCRNMVFADHTFDYAQRLQAEARIFRMGQERDVDYWNIDCECGLDGMIRNCLSKKTRLLDEIKNEIETVGIDKWKEKL